MQMWPCRTEEGVLANAPVTFLAVHGEVHEGDFGFTYSKFHRNTRPRSLAQKPQAGEVSTVNQGT
jgi:hypothetical protein